MLLGHCCWCERGLSRERMSVVRKSYATRSKLAGFSYSHTTSYDFSYDVSRMRRYSPTFVFQTISKKTDAAKAPSTSATMSKQHCRMLQVEQFFRQSQTLLRHCCWCGRGLRSPNLTFHNDSCIPVYFGVKRSKVKVATSVSVFRQNAILPLLRT